MTNLKFEKPITKGRTKLFNQALLFVITLNKDDDSNIKSCWVTSDARHPRVFTRKKNMSENGPFVSFCLFWPGFGLSGLVMAFRACVWPF